MDGEGEVRVVNDLALMFEEFDELLRLNLANWRTKFWLVEYSDQFCQQEWRGDEFVVAIEPCPEYFCWRT